MYYWSTHEATFSPHLLAIGTIGSVFQIAGGVSLNLAIGASKVAGPPIAIISCQMILMTVAVTLINGQRPSTVQLLGLAVGLMGALVLAIPDQLKMLLK